MHKTNVWFFGGGIGVGLLGRHFLYAVRARIPERERSRLFFVAPNNAALYTDLLSGYPDIEVVVLNRTRLFFMVRMLARFALERNLVHVTKSFGRTPLFLMCFAWCLTRARHASAFAGFEVRGLRRYLQDIAVPFPLAVSVFKTTADVAEALMASRGRAGASDEIGFRYCEDPHLLPMLGLEPKKYVVLHPFAATRSRQFPNSRYVRLIEHLVNTYPNLRVVMTGAEKDRVDAEAIRDQLSKRAIAHTLVQVGTLTLQEVATVIAHTVVYIGPDTGVTHLAAHLAVPVLVLGNNSNPSWLPTYSRDAIILTADTHCTCTGAKGGDCFAEFERVRYYRCMLEVTDSAIKDALAHAVHKNK